MPLAHLTTFGMVHCYATMLQQDTYLLLNMNVPAASKHPGAGWDSTAAAAAALWHSLSRECAEGSEVGVCKKQSAAAPFSCALRVAWKHPVHSGHKPVRGKLV